MTEKKTKSGEDFEKLRCSRCGSAFGYVQIKKDSWKCRKCNFEEPLKDKTK